MTTTIEPPETLEPGTTTPVLPPVPTEPVGHADRSDRADRPTPRWVLPAFIALLVATAAAYLWNLTDSGYANSFYAAAVQAGTKSWKAFFFGSLDSSNFITVDKSPGSLWIMELSGRIFGFSSWSMLMPEVLEGVAAVALVYAAVKRWFGAPAGLIAGAVLATTPVAALMFRFNNPDAFMVLLLTAAAYTLIRALEKAGTRWILATGALVGAAFLAKMLQSFTVVPAFAGVYLLAAPTSLGRRVWQLLLSGLAVAVAAGWWVAAVALWPVSARPLIDGSPDNSILNLIFGYNGVDRLTGGSAGGGANFSGPTGVFRLFNDLMGGQAAWLIPAALVTLVAGVVWRGKAPRADRTRAALLLWGGWLLVTGAVFSLSSGVIHTYYTVALAPAIAALVGMGAALLWEQRHHLVVRILGAGTILGTGALALELLSRSAGYDTWLYPVIVVSALGSAGSLVAAPYLGRVGRRLDVAMVVLGLVACLSGPVAYTATTLGSAHTGSLPSAGPALTVSTGGQGGPGGGSGGGLPGGSGGTGSAPVGTAPTGGAATGGSGAPPGFSGGASGGRGVAGGGTGSAFPPGTAGGAGPVRTGSSGTPAGFGSGGGAGGGTNVSSALASQLTRDASSYRWVAATFGSQSAASLELASGEAVMAIGGFNGQGGNISLATFESYVTRGEIHYFIASGTGGGGPGRNANSDAAITSWVESHYRATTIDGQTVYNLTSTSR